jgi:hypothetical protein
MRGNKMSSVINNLYPHLDAQASRLYPHLATPSEVERHSIHLTALLIEAVRNSLGQSYFTDFTNKVLLLADFEKDRLSMSMPLDKETFSAVADFYAETFPA